MRYAFVLGLVAVALLGCDEEKAAKFEPEVGVNVQAQAPAAPPASAKVEDSGPPPWADRKTPGSGFPCGVEEVLAASCRRCHWDPRENDAPFEMVRWEDTQKSRSGKPIHVLMKHMVEADLMPPLNALVKPPVTPLSPEQKKTLLAWLGEGAPRSDEVCE